MRNALASLPQPTPRIPLTLIPFLAEVSDGDARQALNSLELALSVCKRREGEDARNNHANETNVQPGPTDPVANESDGSSSEDADRSLMEAIKKGLRKGYDRTGEDRYDLISALHKSIRGSDGSAALYWLARCVKALSTANLSAQTSARIGCWKAGRTRFMLLAGWLW